LGGNLFVFEEGGVDGALNRGVVRVSRLTLSNPQVKVISNGTVTTEGRIDMTVHAATSKTSRELQGALPLIVGGVAPQAAALARANRLLSDRVVAARVTGTISSPNVQILPLPTLAHEGVKFLLGTNEAPGL
ncbi:MAG: AsmA-like C-terminal region-containing protein, partial [Planctomycetia bacterium]